MPRVKSDTTETVRLELGLWEREQIEKVGTLFGLGAVGKSIGTIATGVGVLVAGMGAWYTGQKLYGWGQEVKDDIDAMVDTATAGLGSEVIFGRGTYELPDGKQISNPLAGIPVLGSLFGSGIMIGAKYNPFD
jgi:hypothetical protein